MVTEDYVSFETAKLLKENGFDAECHSHYYPCHYPDGSIQYHKDAGTKDKKNRFYYEIYSLKNLPKDHYLAPTLQMAMKWLRDVHNLVIQIEFIDFLEHGEVWLYSIIERKTIKQLTGRDEDFTEHSYEEACDAAIKYCLENLV